MLGIERFTHRFGASTSGVSSLRILDADRVVGYRWGDAKANAAASSNIQGSTLPQLSGLQMKTGAET